MKRTGFRASEWWRRWSLVFALGLGIGLACAGLWLRVGLWSALVCAGVGVCFDLWLGAILARKAGI